MREESRLSGRGHGSGGFRAERHEAALEPWIRRGGGMDGGGSGAGTQKRRTGRGRPRREKIKEGADLRKKGNKNYLKMIFILAKFSSRPGCCGSRRDGAGRARAACTNRRAGISALHIAGARLPAEETFHADRHCFRDSCPCGRVSLFPVPPVRIGRRLRLRLFLLEEGRLCGLLHGAGTLPARKRMPRRKGARRGSARLMHGRFESKLPTPGSAFHAPAAS